MSIPLAPTTLTPGVAVNIPIMNVSTIQALKLSNSSPYDLTISGFGVIGSEIVPGGTEYRLYAEQENRGTLLIVPVDNTQAGGTGFINIVLYGMDEPLPKGNWPVAIPTQKVTAKVTSVTNLVNDGNSPGTQIIEATPSGDGSSAVSVLNDGTLVLGNATHKGSISCSNGAFTVDTGGNVTNQNATVQGTLSVAGVTTLTSDATFSAHPILTNNTPLRIKDSGGTARDVLLMNAANEISIKGVSGTDKINIQTSGGVGILAFDSATGLTLQSSSKIALQVGSLDHASGFSGTGNGSVDTGLGVAPFRLFPNPCTASGSSQTIGMTNAQTTQVTTGAGLAWQGFAWH